MLVDGNAGSFGAQPIVDPDFMPFTIVTQAGPLDTVHLGDRNLVDNGNWAWGTRPNTGAQPSWLPNSNQATPQVTNVGSLNVTLTSQTALGVLYNVSNGGGSFDIVLGFTDNTSVTVTMIGPDWYGNLTPPNRTPASGLAAQRQLGVYNATGNVDLADFDNPLNVAEAVVNAASLQAAGLPNIAGKTLATITFQNPHSLNPAYPDPTVGSGFAIYAATLGSVVSGSTCYANCDHSTGSNFLNVNDFVCFQQRFAAADPYADCDHSGTLNVNDFVCFQQRFAAGCSAP
jgi:hypothetical protein